MKFHGREAVQIENDRIRVTILAQGGHIAEILHKESGVNPLWTPPWKSMEPSRYRPARHLEYGPDCDGKLLAGIMGHNLCLDMFGDPSPEEAAAGFSTHGEASVARYKMTLADNEVHAAAKLSLAGLRFERTVRLDDDGVHIRISESVENLLAIDRPIAWTEHVTLGPPFLEQGVTQFDLRAERSRVMGPPCFGDGKLVAGADFTWPLAPTEGGGSINLATFTGESSSSQFTTHLMDRTLNEAGFNAYNPTNKVLFGYRWKRRDFPWLGIWEENRFRGAPPWNQTAVACGMEFGASPFPETRRAMIDRGRLFGEPVFHWLPARSAISVEYAAFVRRAESPSD